MSCSIPGLEKAGCLFLFGYNPNTSHPIVARRIIKAKENGAKIIVGDPRYMESVGIADIYLPLANGTNLALLNSFAYAIVEQGLHDKEFIDKHTVGFDEWWKVIEQYTPESTQSITGIEASMLREAARMYAIAEPSAVICWGMGVTQHKQNVQAVQAIAAIACIAGQIGKPNSGVAPVRGQNNVQGSCDTSCLPNIFPGYQPVTDAKAREKFALAWGVPVEKLSGSVGCKLTNIGHRIDEGELRAFYIMGEDPLQSEPDTSNLAMQLRELDLLVCQDIFMTQTCLAADVILPATAWGEHEGVFTASDRSFQRFSAAVSPKGECRHDWEIIQDLSSRMGHPMNYTSTKEIWDKEMRALWSDAYGATYEKMEGVGYAQWPITALDHPGTPDLHLGGNFNKPDGKARLIASEFEYPSEKPNTQYPLILCTVREVGHYSCRSMTGNSKALSALADEPGFAQINPDDALERGVKHEDLIWVSSRRGKILTRADVTDRCNKGAIYMTYQWWIGKCNTLTIHQLDSVSATPEAKFSACEVKAIEDQAWAEKHLLELYNDLKAKMFNEAEPQYAE